MRPSSGFEEVDAGDPDGPPDEGTATGGGHVVVLRPRPVPGRDAPGSTAPGSTAPGPTGPGTTRPGPAPGGRRPAEPARRPPGGGGPEVRRGASVPPRGTPASAALAPGAAWRPPARPLGVGRSRPGGPSYARRRLAVASVLAAVVLIGMLVVSRVAAPLPAPVLDAAGSSTVVPGAPPALPWPAVGQAALAVPAAGVTAQSGAERPVPVASLTKIMTAYLVLKDHPLATSVPGPTVTMTATDVADAAADERAGDTSVPVTAGERLTERQLLDGLMVHSANNFADTLARWDAGSIGAFVAKMNAEAAALGMTGTHYADASGVSHGSVSTAADQLRLTARAMSVPAFAAVVAQPTITEPGAGLLANYVSLVGQDGVVGVKSGFTQAAMGCVVLAAERQVGSRTVLVLAATTGQQGWNALQVAQNEALGLIDAAAGAVRQRTVVAAGTPVGSLRVPWRPAPVPVSAHRSVTVLEWPGATIRRSVATRRLGPSLPGGATVGTLTVSEGAERVSTPIVTGPAVTAPGAAWRLWR